ncbi:cell division protein FtsQ/DivIB [Dialister micraerophilus]|uniref:POTRA domain protein, FtsQ-type n=1 Tax=Dialister micraerophilus UPII 345-E TaxID=910314 RepID=E4L7H5_9FIRM|nr:FtsQ-type POTRA domain-containing protein [Dialister micraerophilus]EFR43271.1 POTRA domain protein, FtsQ-type [Dialister micraerophilus UPII 345-E]
MHEYNDFENFPKKIRNEHVNVSENDNKDLNDKNFDDKKIRKVLKKRKKHKKNKKFKVLFYLIIFIIIIVVSLLFLPIPFGNLTVTGHDIIKPEDIFFEAEIKKPINIFQIRTSNVEKRLLNDIRIEEVDVSRQFPFTINIKVKERKPLVIVQGEFCYAILDKTGLVIETETSLKKANYPMITGKKWGNLLLGDTVSESDVLLALKFINSLSEDGVKLFSEINIGNKDNIIAYTRSGIAVKLGNGKNIADQAKLAENMVGDISSRQLSVEYIDANTSSPFIKLKK